MTSFVTAPLPDSSRQHAGAPSGTPPRRHGRAAPFVRLGRDSAYVLLGFPLATASFIALVTGLSLSAGLLVTLVGIPVAVLTLAVARGFALLERSRLQLRGERVPPPRYLRLAEGGVVRRWLNALRDPQAWLDLAHGILAFPVAVATWVLVVTWWAGALSGLTYVAWEWALPRDDADNQTLSELLGWDGRAADLVLTTAAGLVFALSLYPVVRGCAAAQAWLARAMLANPHVNALRDRVEHLTASRAAAVEAEASTLRRLERDIHDGPQQRLVRLSMDLGTVQRRLQTDPQAAGPLVDEALTQTQEALAELRALSRGIAPPILADRGLPAALAAAAARCTVRVDLDVALPDGERLSPSVENAAYFVATEALTNVAKHSGATRCSVRVARSGGTLRVEVTDDGVGGAHAAKGHGLAGLADRLAALDGRLDLASPPGGPTVLTAEVPCGSS